MSVEPMNESINEEEEEQWEDLKDHSDYEICKSYPYIIRRKLIKEYILKETFNKSSGYITVQLNRKTYYKHRLIALQWIPNPDNLTQVDHINHNRIDNRIENLRWVSVQMNAKNKSSHLGRQYTFLDELPETAESLDSYNGHDLSGVYIDYKNEKLYLFNGVKYRELLPMRCKGNIRYCCYDIEDKRVYLYHKVLFG